MLSVQPRITLELDENERVLHVARRHWIVLLQRGLIPFILGISTASLAFYRAVGGTFLVSGVTLGGTNDFANWLILGVMLVFLVLWLRGRTKSTTGIFTRDIPYLMLISILGLLFIFRYGGGRLFHIDPMRIGTNDTLNLSLFTVTIFSILMLIYIVIDWANDFLILTTTRVIYDDQQLFVRHIQQQLLVNDIQQVNLRQGSYPEWWFDYGTILIRSFSPRRLTFEHAANPKAMQDKIMAEVNKIRRQSEPEALRQMIEDQVYGNKPANVFKPAIYVETRKGLFPKLFHPNPEINYEREEIMWRPFWFFTFLMLLRPIGTFLLATIALILLLRLDFITPSIVFALWIPVFLACGGWAFWIHQEYENDRYILTRQNITDADKRPLGPETRRVAPLGAIQDITYNVGFFETILESFFGLGFGDVVIETGGAGGGKFTFYHVPDPRAVQATINDYLTDFRKHEKERQLQDAVALLKLYHEAQADHRELVSETRISELIAQQIAAQTTPNAEVQQAEDTRKLVREEIARLLRARRLGRHQAES
jgi:hypothetical protein